MIKLRPACARGYANHGWLRSWHSFSYAEYFDPEEMGWGPLRVINEDFLAPGCGFGKHKPHDMEIITYLLDGPLQQEDDSPRDQLVRRPAVQRMSAGRGIELSQFNASESENLHLLQIWIEPDVRGILPEQEEKIFVDECKRDRWCLVASPDGAERSLTIYQNARLYASLLSPGRNLDYRLQPQRRAYLQVISGDVMLNGVALKAGDGARIADEAELVIMAQSPAELLLLDLP